MRVTRFVTMALLLTLAGCGGPAVARERSAVEEPAAERLRPVPPAKPRRLEPASEPRQRPNIVLVLMDDFSMDLLPTMRSAAAMRRAGASYSHAFVVDSFCCPSRTSLLTGQYPHQTGVLTNVRGERSTPLGGFDAYDAYGNAERSFNVSLQAAGYTTGFFGKFLNHYERRGTGGAAPALPGWSEFEAVFGTAYDQWDFGTGRLGRDGLIHVAHHPAPPAEATPDEKDEAYAGVRIERSALDFIRRHRDDEAPYFLRGRALRSAQPHHVAGGPLPRRPAVPRHVPRPALAGAPGRELRPGPVPGARHRRTSRATAMRPPTTCPRPATGGRPKPGTPAPAWAPAWPPGCCGTGPGWCSRSTGWCSASWPPWTTTPTSC